MEVPTRLQDNNKIIHYSIEHIAFSAEYKLSTTIVKKKKNSVALVRERTIPTERPPPVGEVSANFCG